MLAVLRPETGRLIRSPNSPPVSLLELGRVLRLRHLEQTATVGRRRQPDNAAQRSSACHPLHRVAETKSESVAYFIPVSVADPRNMHRTGLLSSILPSFGFATSRT